MKRAVFFDKDGTLVPDIPYNCDPAKMVLAEGAAECLRALADCGYLLVVVSNQSGVARGYFEERALGVVTERLQELCAGAGVDLDGVYYCVHHPEAKVARLRRECDCRKPQSGMLRKAATELGVSLNRSWMVGDILNDVQAGNAAGTRTILLDNGNETEWTLTRERMPDHIVGDLREVAGVILALDSVRTRTRQLAVPA